MTVSLTIRNLVCGWEKPELYESGLRFDFADNFGLLPIMGRTGYGKTTLLNVLSGYMAPMQGTVTWAIQDRTIGWSRARPLLPQDRLNLPFGIARQGSDLPQVFSIGETLVNLLRFRGYGQSEARTRARRAIDTFRTSYEDTDRLADHYPHELSGGMRQRMALACAVAHDPAVVFADEPTASLDMETREEVLAAVTAWLRGGPEDDVRAFIYVTHSYDDNTTLAGSHRSDEPLNICFVDHTPRETGAAPRPDPGTPRRLYFLHEAGCVALDPDSQPDETVA